MSTRKVRFQALHLFDYSFIYFFFLDRIRSINCTRAYHNNKKHLIELKLLKELRFEISFKHSKQELALYIFLLNKVYVKVSNILFFIINYKLMFRLTKIYRLKFLWATNIVT